METKWTRRWNSWIAAKPVKPGVFRRKEGGFLIRGKSTDPRTGRRVEIRMNLPHTDASVAYRTLQQEIANVREGSRPQKTTKIRFSDYVVSLFERKIRKRKIKSMKSREVWFNVMKVHLLPAFGATGGADEGLRPPVPRQARWVQDRVRLRETVRRRLLGDGPGKEDHGACHASDFSAGGGPGWVCIGHACPKWPFRGLGRGTRSRDENRSNPLTWKDNKDIRRSSAGLTQLVECQLPKLNVGGSNPLSRSIVSAGSS
jgi:hypothetical protein